VVPPPKGGRAPQEAVAGGKGLLHVLAARSAVRLVAEEQGKELRGGATGKAWQKCGRSGNELGLWKALPSSGSAHASAPPMLDRPVSRQRLLLDALV